MQVDDWAIKASNQIQRSRWPGLITIKRNIQNENSVLLNEALEPLYIQEADGDRHPNLVKLSIGTTIVIGARSTMYVCMYVCIIYYGHAPSRVWAVTER